MDNIFPKSLSASLTRRLAEAADGFRNVKQVYLVAGYKFPHPIKHFYDLDSAKEYFSEKQLAENEFGIFGPFKTSDAVEKLHFVGVEDITKVDLTIHYKDGRQQHMTLPGEIDSIFFNLSSFDKFIFPYYCYVRGPEFAEEMREKLIAYYENAAKGIHGNKHTPRLLATAVGHSGGTYFLQLDLGDELT